MKGICVFGESWALGHFYVVGTSGLQGFWETLSPLACDHSSSQMGIC